MRPHSLFLALGAMAVLAGCVYGVVVVVRNLAGG